MDYADELQTAPSRFRASGVVIANLSHFRQVLGTPGVWIELVGYKVGGVERVHKWAGVQRQVAKLQSNAVMLYDPNSTENPSRLDFGNASSWHFDGNRATTTSGESDWRTELTYQINELATGAN